MKCISAVPSFMNSIDVLHEYTSKALLQAENSSSCNVVHAGSSLLRCKSVSQDDNNKHYRRRHELNAANWGCLRAGNQRRRRSTKSLDSCISATAEGSSASGTSTAYLSASQRAFKFMEKQFLPLGLLTSLIVG
jgi:hypothetical protein